MSETQSAAVDGQQLNNRTSETVTTELVEGTDALIGSAVSGGMSAPSRGFVERLVDGKPVRFR